MKTASRFKRVALVCWIGMMVGFLLRSYDYDFAGELLADSLLIVGMAISLYLFFQAVVDAVKRRRD